MSDCHSWFGSARSKCWEPVELEVWRGAGAPETASGPREYDERHLLLKTERMPDGTTKLILKEKASGRIVERTG